jgi:hypothetical protein
MCVRSTVLMVLPFGGSWSCAISLSCWPRLLVAYAVHTAMQSNLRKILPPSEIYLGDGWAFARGKPSRPKSWRSRPRSSVRLLAAVVTSWNHWTLRDQCGATPRHRRIRNGRTRDGRPCVRNGTNSPRRRRRSPCTTDNHVFPRHEVANNRALLEIF